MICTVEGCSAPVVAQGLCGRHYKRVQKHGDVAYVSGRWAGHVKVDKTCEVEGCEARSRRARYCPKHTRRYYKYGDPIYEPPRVAYNRATEAGFWARVQKGAPDECWEWQGGRVVGKWPYGVVVYQGKRYVTHRLAFLLTHGYLPGEGRMVCHHCDNPPCCNPAHLYDGSNSDNQNDKHSRGRGGHRTGTDHAMSKLTAEQQAELVAACDVLEHERIERGLSRWRRGQVSAVAARYEVAPSTVHRIWRRSKISHV